jgi:hypothetical protein
MKTMISIQMSVKRDKTSDFLLSIEITKMLQKSFMRQKTQITRIRQRWIKK